MTGAGVRGRTRIGVADEQAFWRARGSGPGVVLINGYGASSSMWPSAWLRELERAWTVVTLDLRGGGRSRFAQTPFTIRDLASDVVAVLDDVGLDRAVVLGLSMGGMVAQETALRSPERVTGLVLVGTRPPVPEFTPPPLEANLLLLRGPGRGRTLADHFRSLWVAATGPGFAERRPDLVDELVDQTLDHPTPRAMLLHQVRAMTGWGHAERLAGLTVPTAVVHGADDRFSPVANGRSLARLVPEATYRELDRVGHLVPLEAPATLTDAIEEVARRCERQRADLPFSK